MKNLSVRLDESLGMKLGLKLGMKLDMKLITRAGSEARSKNCNKPLKRTPIQFVQVPPNSHATH